MIRQLFLLSSIASIDAFLTPPSSLHAPNSIASSWQSTHRHPSSPLHADASPEGEGAPEEAAAEEASAALPSEDASDILNSPAFLQRKVEVLESDIAAIEKEIEEANAVYVAGKEEWGAKFDMLNKESQSMQERLAKQGSQGREMATVEVAQNILNVLDNYDRAFQAIEAATNEEVEIVEAYKKTQEMILDAFTELNVTKVETVGAEFDYEKHQAMMQMPSDEYEEGIVCQEFAPGWTCGEKLIRPAMVVVAM
eukprot:CAMPEP_0183723892 /NCGR_PEP_ID=MMETSP0737-20130205/16670_1 /TAXON_ID=385413 /ORGANISM="Thalassiosira miniscula, Strain CCMP1093" /LENGTH=252 /DNA_ID=CAMNT_0025954311 /DNA_START=46 /DNA_END=804 /DNA_ORIENTATION=-